jgi:hypothetical protein
MQWKRYLKIEGKHISKAEVGFEKGKNDAVLRLTFGDGSVFKHSLRVDSAIAGALEYLDSPTEAKKRLLEETKKFRDDSVAPEE